MFQIDQITLYVGIHMHLNGDLTCCHRFNDELNAYPSFFAPEYGKFFTKKCSEHFMVSVLVFVPMTLRKK